MPSRPVLPLDALAAPRNRWDMTFEALLAVLLAFMPLAYGAVEAWSELVVVSLAAVMSTLVVLRIVVDRTFRPSSTWAYAPLAGFALLLAFQLAPLPTAWVATLSPQTAALRNDLLGNASAATTQTLSLYAPATAHSLRLFLAGAAVFFTTASVFCTAPQIKRLLLVVFVVGCAEALLALLQIFTLTDRMYWIFDFQLARLTSGSFVNYSNFCQFMNLSIGAGLALLLVRMQDDKRRTQGRSVGTPSFGGVRLSDHGSVFAGLVLCSIAVFASLSRNGAISLIVAAVVVGTALRLSGTLSQRAWVLGMLPLAALAVLLLFGFDPFFDRLATLRNEGAYADRWEMTLGALRAWQEFPLWGAGMGTHEFVFPMFDSSTSAQFAVHADNDYAQLLEETGVIGALLVGSFLAIIGTMLYKLCRRGRKAISSAAFGLLLGLVATAIHSASDFGQRLPAVFCLSAVTCGLIVQLERLRRQSRPHAAATSPRRDWTALRRCTAAAGLVALAACWTWVLKGAFAAHVGEQWWYAAEQLNQEIQRVGPAAKDQEYADLLAAAEQAVAHEPANVVYGYWLNVFRWQAISRDVDPATGGALLTRQARSFVERIADDLARVRTLGPTYGPPYAFEGQLRLSGLHDEAGATLIRKGARLAPYDAPTCLIAGEVAARDGQEERAVTLLARAVKLAPHLFRDAAQVLLLSMDRPDLARQLAAGDHTRMSILADIASTSEKHKGLAADFRSDAEEALHRRAATDHATAQELASLASIKVRDGKLEEAVPFYVRALTLDYNQIDWRLALARTLADLGDDDRAMHQARICLRLRPGHDGAKQLIADLSVRPQTE